MTATLTRLAVLLGLLLLAVTVAWLAARGHPGIVTAATHFHD
jgi:hypothetical protein